MQSFFEEEITKLRKRMLKSFSLVEGQLDKSFQVLLKAETDLIESIKKDENKVDELEIKIDKLCQRIFALTQPVASDLRFIMASLRIGNEMESIADVAYDISKRSESVNQMPEFVKKFGVKKLTGDIKKAYAQTFEAYNNRNSALACEIVGDCKKLKDESNTIFRSIVAEMSKKSEVIVIATDLILIIKDLERICGHIENVAEEIVFTVDAKIIKHNSPERKK